MNSQEVVFSFSLFLVLVSLTRGHVTKREGELFILPKRDHKDLLPTAECGLSFRTKMIGGIQSEMDEFPWSALIQYSDRRSNTTFFGCGGVLITAKFVLTAAHCTAKETIPKHYRLSKVRLGEWDISKEKDCSEVLSVCNEPVQDIDVQMRTRHVDYKPDDPTQNNDIALIMLRNSAVFNENVRPICIPLDSLIKNNYEGHKHTIAGWGRTLNGQGPTSDIQQTVDLLVKESSSCLAKNSSEILKTQMCAGGGLERGSCFGDSGGPLMKIEMTDQPRYHVTGILSIRPETCGKEAVYTMVAPHVEWIMDQLRLYSAGF